MRAACKGVTVPILCLLMQASTAAALIFSVSDVSKHPTKVQVANTQAPGQNFSSLTVPFEYFKHHIFLALSLDGRPGYEFMIDTGANCNVLNLPTARALGLTPGKLEQVGRIGLGDGLIYTAAEQQVNVVLDSLPVASTMSVMDLEDFARHFDHRTDGILGLPFFERFVVRVDFEHGTITLSSPTRRIHRGLGDRIRLRRDKRGIVVPVVIGSSRNVSQSTNVFVDTGGNFTLMLYDGSVRRLKLEQSRLRAQPGKAYGLNGFYAVNYASIHSLRIGGAEALHVPVDYIKLAAGANLSSGITGAIGTGALQSFQAIIFDLSHRQMILFVRRPALEPGTTRIETAQH